MHRLDYGTCGLMIATKCKDAYIFDQFCSKKILKVYKILCFTRKNKNILFYSNKKISIINLGNFKIRFINYKLVVGKRHQIRLQIRDIIGDRTYNTKLCLKSSWNVFFSSIKHQFLTSCLLSYEITKTKRVICIETKLSQTFRYILIILFNFN
ncbi:pseudouridine synthase, RluA family [Candidatus Hodgkinia cicadicola]|uniref:Pseudouridine synthase, RluA family n=1 Tax=Candidatus Hodgkinia cicadicola TaxID=573658 RepID=A0ABX4MGP7_9HYPH|nr:pseudouridine synthase, RluA family [Candidatus Hodgkinia cicadicola]